jgi:hypothetical protein
LHLRLAQAGVRLADALNQAYAARGWEKFLAP